MTHIGVAVQESTRVFGKHVKNFLLDQQRADRRVATAETLGDGDYIGADSLLLAGVQRTGATHAAHHLIQNEQDAVAVTDLAHAPEIARHCRHCAERGPDHGFGDKGDDVFTAKFINFAFELFSQASPISFRRFITTLAAIFVNRRYMMGLDQQRTELFALPFAPANRKRAERNTMIALTAGDDETSLQLPTLDKILAR